MIEIYTGHSITFIYYSVTCIHYCTMLLVTYVTNYVTTYVTIYVTTCTGGGCEVEKYGSTAKAIWAWGKQGCNICTTNQWV